MNPRKEEFHKILKNMESTFYELQNEFDNLKCLAYEIVLTSEGEKLAE